MAFSHKEYEAIIESLLKTDKQLGGVADFLAAQNPTQIILRHDVDRFPKQASEMALLEQRMGVQSTFYFRADSSGSFPESEISAIAQLGHEVGYHYEDLSFCKGNRSEAIVRFSRNLETFRKFAPCKTVSMHGAPLSKYHNQDLLSAEDLQREMLLGDAVASIELYAPYYLTDTGGRWLASATNLRDRVSQAWPAYALPEDLTAFHRFALKSQNPLYISTHPERWCNDMPSFLRAQALDIIVNSIKFMLSHARSFVKI